MASHDRQEMHCTRLELGGIRYVILAEATFDALCERAGIDVDRKIGGEDPLVSGLVGGGLGEKLVRRRRAVGLSQVDLARRAGIRAESLNRIERGKADPAFSTVRKLVEAMRAAEREHAANELT